MTAADRYQSFARLYDVLAGEPVYRTGRLRGIAGLRLRPGQAVVDAGCGTGLNFAHLEAALGPGGRIVGIDASCAMLDQARKRIRRAGWANIDLVHADLTAIAPTNLADLVHEAAPQVDAVLATYSLSVTGDAAAAWERILALCAPGTRVAVVDMQLPTGPAAALAPIAALACRLGGSDPSAHPWTLLEHDTPDTEASSLRGGHIQIRAGTPSRSPQP
ncbi:class I SAM-dependent methyltransferase [Sinomonas terrae]|uniref:Class I SAM-dependent methyltransferase n=1 Tax=Sinomonas terrae TaxID=2908838 RepID=A0ABS9U176_9MICC|nr:class I SAM-dependent methyltransferase [Sinomonas terrae]MCH6470421.1 class I SAM-dependent methyltransferase [Sinomonas terrae]